MASGSPPPISATEEVESTISRLSNYRNVHGVMILSRQGGIIRTEGPAFGGDSGKLYAKTVKGMVEGVRSGIVEVDETDDLRLLRIRTKKHELIITPDDKYLLIVLQDPS
ncbi:hypothetical protein NliqN6_3540 [Naganishia liquefaciens]|uniref:Roadblock/LAMTOR2 domain-containing protein n=1 Tax=Naganishia liquefaciens TaxID=104408 RepID=A0A8H3TUI5_9TREE|nr:hypothetical protein NliqN6_3540 [Naganishia liquefaciens]